MHYITRIKLLGTTKSVMPLVWLVGILFSNSCGCYKNAAPPDTAVEKAAEPAPPEEPYDEIVVFCGNPGVGKSALLNSIFQKVAFPSGPTIGGGLTHVKQEYIYENRMYIDTPGLSDISFRQQAASEIEKALKENNNYKIIFVLTLEGGRIKPDDLATINIVCEAIQAPFEYGIIFNKVTKGVLESCNQSGKAWAAPYLSLLHKQPSSDLIIEADEDMEAAYNVYLPADSKSRKNLLDFIANLKASKITPDQVQEVNGKTYEERHKEMEKQVTDIQRQISEIEARMKENCG